ncbi:MAG: radical SAM protein [Desulfobacteraceae bacterium]|nr:MAG: radical SAM protein [Desulfobacteraceae bacterium]
MALTVTIIDLFRFAFGGRAPVGGPLKVQIEITHRCNSRCKSCFFWRRKAMGELSVQQWQEVLRDIKRIGGRRVAFGGGEPTLYEGIFDLIRFAKRLGLNVSLGTNGLRLAEFHGEVSKSGLDVIEISLDGPPEIHNENRGIHDAFERTMEGVARLVAHRQRPTVQFNFTPNRINYLHLGEMAKIAASSHAEILSIEPAHLLNKQLHLTPDLFVPLQDIDEFERQMNKVIEAYSSLLSPPLSYYRMIPDFLRDPLEARFSKRFRCISGFWLLVLEPLGNVYGCPAKERKIGNVQDTPLGRIWRSMPHLNDIARVRKGNHKGCWLNSVSPANIFCQMVRQPRSWVEILRIAGKEMGRRV